MHIKLKAYLTDLIVEHGVTDLDSLGEHELGKILEYVKIQDLLFNDSEYIELVEATDWSNPPPSFLTKSAEIAKSIIIDFIQFDFDDLLIINRPVDNSHEDAPRTPEVQDWLTLRG